MKQLNLTNILTALDDQPKAIGQRLEDLGVSKEELGKNFSEQILSTSVYGSSFLKFLQDNADKLHIDEGIPPQELPADFKNGFGQDSMSVNERLESLGMKPEHIKGLFSKDVLDLSLNGDEFQDLLLQNQDKILDHVEQLATQGGQNG